MTEEETLELQREVDRKERDARACPIDPAEASLCEGCG